MRNIYMQNLYKKLKNNTIVMKHSTWAKAPQKIAYYYSTSKEIDVKRPSLGLRQDLSLTIGAGFYFCQGAAKMVPPSLPPWQSGARGG